MIPATRETITHATSENVDALERRFGEAVADIERLEFGHHDDESPEAAERFHVLESELSDCLREVVLLTGADLPTLRLKARAIVHCNPALSHFDGEPLDQQLTRQIVLRLARGDAAGRAAQ